jgi:hypothetical protein
LAGWAFVAKKEQTAGKINLANCGTCYGVYRLLTGDQHYLLAKELYKNLGKLCCEIKIHN